MLQKLYHEFPQWLAVEMYAYVGIPNRLAVYRKYCPRECSKTILPGAA